ncbi:MAG: hypothetical protein WBC04_07810 [Candidatus Acidiferrales bacterium]
MEEHPPFGPGGEFIGFDGSANVGTEDRQVLSQIESLPQFGDGRVTLGDVVNWGGHQKPVREAVFAHPGSRDREKLEQPAAAEKVEVGGVNMIRIGEAATGCAGACPAIFDSGQASLIECLGPFGASARANHAIVDDDQCQKNSCGHKQPRG